MIDFLIIVAFCFTMAFGIAAVDLGLEFFELGSFFELVMAGFCLFGVLLIVLLLVRVVMAGM